jgi:hypothetical protein
MFVLCSWGAMRLGVSMWMDGLNEVDEQNDFQYDSSFFAMNGDFGARDVRITHYEPDGSVSVVLLADRMVVHTPGLHWLWWSTFRGSKKMPDEIGLTLENVRDASRTAKTAGGYSNLPFDAMGCGKTQMTPETLQAMGLPEPRRDTSLWLRRKDDQVSTLSVDLVTRDIGEARIDLDVGVERPLKWRESVEQLSQAKVQGAKITLRDLGFIAARNN